MQADIEASAREIEPHGAHQLQADLPLGRHRKRTRQRQGRGVSRLPLARRDDEIRQDGAQRREDRIDARPPHAGVVSVQQRVVGRKAERSPLGLADAASQPQHLFEIGTQPRKIRIAPCLAPDHLAARRRFRGRLDEIARHRRRVGIGPAHLAQVGPLPFAEVALRLRRVEPLGVARVGEDLVGEHAQHGQLLAAGIGGAVRHLGLRVPAEDTARILQRAEPGEGGGERRVSLHDRWRSLGVVRDGQSSPRRSCRSRSQ